MANNFTNVKSSAIGTTPVDVYTCPVGIRSVVHGLFVSNLLSTSVKINVSIGTLNVLKNIEVLPETTLVINKPINLIASDVLKISSDTLNSVDVFISMLEVS